MTTSTADLDLAEPVTDEAPEFSTEHVVYKKTATTEADAQTAKLAAIAERGAFRATGRVSTENPWRSGWCGSYEHCLDGKPDPVTEVPQHRCMGRGENGAKITPRYIFCACTCHSTNPAAVQHLLDDDVASSESPAP